MSTTFADLGVPAPLVSNLHAAGIDAPFPIQAATIPDALAGRDLCGRAPTGSGKTIAFGIPMVLRTGKARPRRPRGLVLVPTRELAAQVSQQLQVLAKPKGPWVEAFYGGVGFDKQIKSLQKGCDIVVACPGRLADLVNQGYVQLDDVDFVVIDEADRMADMGFLPEVKRLLDQCSEQRQTLLFSATLDGDVDVLIKRYQHNPARHELFADEDDLALADHYFFEVNRLDRLKTAAAAIKRLGPTVVFCKTKRGADRIATQLDAAGVRAAAIHGDRSQSQREAALRSFHQGRVQALVATDVAARGIHVDGVTGVIHYDPPHDHKDYVHRSGRTARAGNRGTVLSLVAPDVRKDVAAIQKALGYPVGLASLDLEALGHATPAAPSAAQAARTTTDDPRPTSRPRVREDERPSRRPDRVRTERPVGRDDRTDRPERPRSEQSGRTEPTDRPHSERTDRARTDRSDRAGTDRSDRARTDRSDRAGTERSDRAGTERTDRALTERRDRVRTERSDRARTERSERPDRDRSERAMPRVERIADLPPLRDGQRRPSGAARRKAKRLAAAELTRLEPETTRDDRSSRPSRSSSRTPSRAPGNGAARGSGTGAERSTSRPSRASTGGAGPRKTAAGNRPRRSGASRGSSTVGRPATRSGPRRSS